MLALMVDHLGLAGLHERCADAAQALAGQLSQLGCDAWRGGASDGYRARLLEVRAGLMDLADRHRAEATSERLRALGEP